MKRTSLGKQIFSIISVITIGLTVIISVIAYFIILNNMQRQTYGQIEQYAQERARYEEEKFRQAEENQQFLKQAFLDHLSDINDKDPIIEFNKIVTPFSDKSLRSPKLATNPLNEGIAFVTTSINVNTDFRRYFVAANDVVNKYGPVMHHRFQNLYLSVLDNAGIIFWPEQPEIGYMIPADYALSNEVGVAIANKQNNIDRTTVWTNLYYGDYSKKWTTSVSTPIDIDGEHIITISNDIFLDEFINRINTKKIRDSQSLVIAPDGSLIMRSGGMEQIKNYKGKYNIVNSNDVYLQMILKLIQDNELNTSIIKNPEYDEFITVNILDKTNWKLVTIYPNSIFTSPALDIAKVIIAAGFIALLLQLIVLRIILRRFITTKLKALSQGAIEIANGNYNIKFRVQYNDEITDLSNALNYMSQSLSGKYKSIEDEIRQSSVELTLSEARFQTIFESFQDAVIQTDLKGNILLVNQAVVRMFGYESPSEIYQLKSVKDAYLRPEDRDELISEVLKEGRLTNHKLRVKRKDGVVIEGEVNMNLIYDQYGNPESTLSIFVDMSKRFLYERKLKSHAKELQDLYDFIPIAYVSYDKDGRVENVNKKTQSILGFKREDFIGKTANDFYFENDGSAEKIQKLLAQGKTVEGEDVQVRNVNGEPVWVRITVQPEYDGHSRRTMFEDITEFKNNEKELKNAILDAEKANKAKSEFLSRMSHELRTPLNAILGFTQMLKLDEISFNDDQLSSIDEISAAGQHLLTMINNILDITKIESGNLTIRMETVDIFELVKQSLSLIEPQLQTENIKVINNVKKGYFVDADKTRLKQVLVNILTNALKYNSENGSITLESKMKSSRLLRITIIDTGEGLSVDDISRLFTPFERLNDLNNIEGTGIGLVISKSLIESMKGNIGINSSIGDGCQFWIEMPLKEVQKS